MTKKYKVHGHIYKSVMIVHNYVLLYIYSLLPVPVQLQAGQIEYVFFEDSPTSTNTVCFQLIGVIVTDVEFSVVTEDLTAVGTH